MHLSLSGFLSFREAYNFFIKRTKEVYIVGVLCFASVARRIFHFPALRMRILAFFSNAIRGFQDSNLFDFY
jgi:hypothetical protein